LLRPWPLFSPCAQAPGLDKKTPTASPSEGAALFSGGQPQPVRAQAPSARPACSTMRGAELAARGGPGFLNRVRLFAAKAPRRTSPRRPRTCPPCRKQGIAAPLLEAHVRDPRVFRPLEPGPPPPFGPRTSPRRLHFKLGRRPPRGDPHPRLVQPQRRALSRPPPLGFIPPRGPQGKAPVPAQPPRCKPRPPPGPPRLNRAQCLRTSSVSPPAGSKRSPPPPLRRVGPLPSRSPSARLRKIHVCPANGIPFRARPPLVSPMARGPRGKSSDHWKAAPPPALGLVGGRDPRPGKEKLFFGPPPGAPPFPRAATPRTVPRVCPGLVPERPTPGVVASPFERTRPRNSSPWPPPPCSEAPPPGPPPPSPPTARGGLGRGWPKTWGPRRMQEPFFCLKLSGFPPPNEPALPARPRPPPLFRGTDRAPQTLQAASVGTGLALKRFRRERGPSTVSVGYISRVRAPRRPVLSIGGGVPGYCAKNPAKIQPPAPCATR